MSTQDAPKGVDVPVEGEAAVTESTDPVAVALLEAENKVSELNDQKLRLMAEFDNYRRRAQREKESAIELGAESLARPLLEVLDNLERAVASAGAAPGPWLAGIQLTLRMFYDALKSAGVVPVDPVGQPFDPVRHEAVSMLISDAVPADHVVNVVTRGYMLNDRVLRPAQVIVSRGPSGD